MAIIMRNILLILERCFFWIVFLRRLSESTFFPIWHYQDPRKDYFEGVLRWIFNIEALKNAMVARKLVSAKIYHSYRLGHRRKLCVDFIIFVVTERTKKLLVWCHLRATFPSIRYTFHSSIVWIWNVEIMPNEWNLSIALS